MSQSLLNAADIAARLEQAGSEGMAEGMRGNPLSYTTLAYRLPQLFRIGSAVQMVTTDTAIIRGVCCVTMVNSVIEFARIVLALSLSPERGRVSGDRQNSS